MNVRQTFLCSLLLMPGVGAGVTTISAALPNVVQQQQKKALRQVVQLLIMRTIL